MMGNRQDRQRRLRKIGWGELAASIILPICGLWTTWPWGDAWPVHILGAISLLIMLFSAALFWLMRAQHLLSGARLRIVSAAMVVSVAIAAVALVLAVMVPWQPWRGIAPIVGVAMPLFTVVEWVNYRWVQISAGGVKAAVRGNPIKPQLARMLDRAR